MANVIIAVQTDLLKNVNAEMVTVQNIVAILAITSTIGLVISIICKSLFFISVFINLNSLNKLLDLQTLIKEESSSKELCKFLFNNTYK